MSIRSSHATKPSLANPWLSRALAHVSAVMALVLVAAGFVWLSPELARYPAHGWSAVGDNPIALTPRARVAGLVVSTAHLAVLAWALLIGRQLFLRFANGRVLEPATAWLLRRLGTALLIFAGLAPVVRSAITFIVTMDNPPGQRMLTIAFSGNEVLLALVAALVLMLGAAMAEAARLADENRQIV